jgi:glutaminyl-tRNA synthetase
MAVLRPLKLVIENYPEGVTEKLTARNHPDNPEAGERQVTFGRELYVERDDFMENPPKKFYRLSPGKEVRLRYGYFVTCQSVVKDAAGEVVELRCTYDPASRGGNAPDGRKVQATIHWVSAADAVRAEVRLYNPLFNRPDPGAEGGDVMADLNPDSVEVLGDALVEHALWEESSHQMLLDALSTVPFNPPTVQFERQGYFCADSDTTLERPVFNRTVGLRDSWAKVAGKPG